jgi:hypothetical protein
MHKNPLLNISLKELIIYLILFNSLFVLTLVFQKYINHPGDDPFYWAVGFSIDRYFFSYHYEFMKKGFIGTIFHFIHIVPTRRLVYLVSWVNANFFLILFLMYVKKMMALIPQKQFSLYIVFFILSPAVSIQLGYSAGLFDHFLILITLTALFVLAGKYKCSYFVIPTLMVMGLLIHEGFLFFHIPVILAVVLNEIKKGDFKFHLFLITSFTITFALYFISIYAGTISDDTLHSLLEIFNGEVGRSEDRDFYPSSQRIWKVTLHTLSLYAHWQTWLGFFVSSIILGIYFTPYLRTFKKHMGDIFILMVLFSPFAIFPMFIVADTFYRWFGLILINMFLLYPYLIKEFKIADLYENFNRIEKACVKTGFILFILGPIGLPTALPYVDAFLRKFLNMSLFVIL